MNTKDFTIFLQSYVEQLGIDSSNLDWSFLHTFFLLLIDWNKKTNLISRKQSLETILVDHFADSLAGLFFGEQLSSTHLVDIGSGAGFPGIPLFSSGIFSSVSLIEPRKIRHSFLSLAISHKKDISAILSKFKNYHPQQNNLVFCQRATFSPDHLFPSFSHFLFSHFCLTWCSTNDAPLLINNNASYILKKKVILPWNEKRQILLFFKENSHS